MNEDIQDGPAGPELIPSSNADSAASEVPFSGDELKSPEPAIDSLNINVPPPAPAQKLTSVLRGHIVLNPGISPINYYASLIHTIVSIFNITTSTTLQPLILLDAATYNVDKKAIGVILAELILIQTLTKISFAPICGFLMDNAGRKPVILLGGAVALLGYLLVPFQTTVFPGYALSKMLVANGGNILTFVPLNADYVHDTSKGKATGISQAFASAGSFLGSVFVTIMLSLKFSLGQIHIAAGVIVMGLVLLYSIGIKGGKYFILKPEQMEDPNALEKANTKADDSFFVKMRKGMKALSRNGWLLIALVISTLARADYYLITIVFSLYVKSYDEDDASAAEIDRSNHLISLYQDLFFGLGFIGNIVYGVLLDRVNSMKIIFPALIFALLGYFLVLFADSKDSAMIILLVVFAGLAMPGLFNTANYLGIKNYPKDLRGVLSGLMNVFGVVGYLFLSTVGGYLFDHTGRSAPFFLFLIMLLLSTIVITVIYRFMVMIEAKRQRRRKKLQESQANQL